MHAAIVLVFSCLFFSSTPQSPAAPDGARPATPVLAWGDFDRDGLEDVYASNPAGDDRLLKNSGDGSFEDVTALAGLGGIAGSRSAAWGDFDRDGWIDLYVSSQRGGGRLLGNAHGRFEDRTEDAGLTLAGAAHDARWFDYDHDRFLDLVLEGSDGSRVLHNRHDGTFERVPLLGLVPPPALSVVAGQVVIASASDALDRAQPGQDPLAPVVRPLQPLLDGIDATGKTSARMHSVGTGTTGGAQLVMSPPVSGGGGAVPSGAMILGESQAAPPGYSFAGLSLTALPVSGEWTTKASMPTARSGLAAAEANGRIYAIGGSDSAFSPLATVEEYDPATNTWASRASMPTARFGLAAAEANGRIYVFGGYDVSLLATVEEYDPATNSWASKASMPTNNSHLAAAEANGKIYAIGGSNSVTVEEYDPATNTWASKASMPFRDILAVAKANGKIYAIGGQNTSSLLATVEEYDPATNTWASKASMPTARNGLAAAEANGKIYAIGGYDGVSWVATVLEYDPDPATNTWASRASMPTARYGLASAEANGKIYAIGGYNGSSLATVEQFEPGRPLYVHRKN